MCGNGKKREINEEMGENRYGWNDKETYFFQKRKIFIVSSGSAEALFAPIFDSANLLSSSFPRECIINRYSNDILIKRASVYLLFQISFRTGDNGKASGSRFVYFGYVVSASPRIFAT